MNYNFLLSLILSLLIKESLNLIKYEEITRNSSLKLNFPSNDSELYAYFNYSKEITPDEKEEKGNFSHFFYMDSRLNVVCEKKLDEDFFFPNETEFNSSFPSDCNIIKLNEQYKIVRYKCVNKMINLFCFFFENETFFEEEMKVEQYDNKLEEKKNNYKVKSKDIILFYHRLNNSHDRLIFQTNPKENFFLYYEENKKFYNKKNFNESSINVIYSQSFFENYYFILVYVNLNNSEEIFSIDFKIDKEEKFSSISLPTFFEPYTSTCYLNPKIEIYNTKNKSFILKLQSNYWRHLKFFNHTVDNLNDLTNLDNYEELIDNFLYIPIDYAIFYIQCFFIDEYYIYYDLIEEKSDFIYEQNYTYFKISQSNNLTFDIINYNNSIIIKLLSEDEGNIIINSIDYQFKRNEIQSLNFNGSEKLEILSDMNLSFAIKSKINENLFEVLELNNNYIFLLNETVDEKYLIFKIEDLNKYDFIRFIAKFNESLDTYEEYGYKNLDEIEQKTLLYTMNIKQEINLKRFQIHENENNKIFYYLLYLTNQENHNYTKIELNSEASKNLLKENEFIKLNYTESEKFVNLFNQNLKIRFFFLPCNSLNIKFSFGGIGSYITYYEPNIYINNVLESTIINYNKEGYLLYKILKEDEYPYSYENNCSNQTYFYILNETYFRYSFSSFSNATDIQYILLISKNNSYINSTCDTFENLYINPIKKDDVEIYNFSSKEVQKIKGNNQCTNDSYIDLKLPKFFNEKKGSFNIRGLGITQKDYHDIKIYDTFVFELNKPTKNVCLLIFIILMIIIVIILCSVIYVTFKSSKSKIEFDNLEKEKVEPLYN